ncbi:MAG: 4-hydroxythreonine-4-phosphate dehydrogenase PdxA [Pseudomonadota bacterium]
MSKTICITCGEPAGIGPEIIEKALAQYQGNARFIILGDKTHFNNSFLKIIDHEVSSLADADYVSDKKFIFCHIPFSGTVQLSHPSADYAKDILNIIEIATIYCCDDPKHRAMVTAPVQKENLAQYDPEFRGHTDFIAEHIHKIYGTYFQPVMMLSAPDLKVVPLSVHIPIQKVPEYVTQQNIIKSVQIIANDLKQKYKMNDPHIAIAGLNPHAGDGGIIGDEDQNIIKPAIEILKKDYHVTGPYAADTMFHPEARKSYDLALCMYHDQALIPIKTIAFDIGINVTLGLPIIRTSPDHGTALNIAGENRANPSSMLAAIYEAERVLAYL